MTVLFVYWSRWTPHKKSHRKIWCYGVKEVTLSSSCNVGNVGTRILERPLPQLQQNWTNISQTRQPAEQNSIMVSLLFATILYFFLAQGLKWWMQYKLNWNKTFFKKKKLILDCTCEGQSAHFSVRLKKEEENGNIRSSLTPKVNMRNFLCSCKRTFMIRHKTQTEHAVVLMNFNYIKWIYVKVEKEKKHWVSSSPPCVDTATEICTWSGETTGHLYSSHINNSLSVLSHSRCVILWWHVNEQRVCFLLFPRQSRMRSDRWPMMCDSSQREQRVEFISGVSWLPTVI